MIPCSPVPSGLPRCLRPALVLLTAVALASPACDRVPLLAPSGSTISVTSPVSTLPLNGAAEIVASVLESAGTPPQNGTLVTFTTTLGRVEPAQVKTNGGRAVTTFYAGTSSGEATIIASSGGAVVAADDGVKIKVGAAAVGQVAVSASPGTVSASGGTSTISATVTDSGGNVLGGVPVTFSTDAGSLSQAIVTTDSTGRAQTTLTTSQQATVTATAGVAGGSTAPPSGTVTVNVNATAALTLSPASPTIVEDQSVTFAISRATGGSAIQRTVVTWGDGQQSTYSGLPGSISHVYLEPGTFTVVVSATDSFGDVSNGTASVTVTAKPAPTVSSLMATPSSPTAGSTVTFSVTITATTGTTIASTTWNFGDGTVSTLSGAATSAQHAFAAGTYTVTVTVRGSNGESASASMILVVS